jgi:hypothetical protein
VPEPIGGFPALPSSVHSRAGEVTPVAIVDAYDPRLRIKALARIDLLDRERRGGRISEAAYLVGRETERAFENMTRIGGGSQWLEGDRIDAATAAELRTVLGIERAHAINDFVGWLVRQIGVRDTSLLRLVLGDGLGLGIAGVAVFGRNGTRGYRYAADRFCDALEVLAEAKAARGRALRRMP